MPLSFLFGLVVKALPAIGKFGKGKATIAGSIATAVGLATGAIAPHIFTDQNIVAVLQAFAQIITAIGTVVGAFGIGRKAGYAASA